MIGVALGLLASGCGNATAPTATIADALAAVPDRALRADAERALEAAAESVRRCAEPVGWAAATDAASAAVDDLTEAARQFGPGWVDTSSARTVADEIRDLLILQRGCSRGFESVTEAERAAALAAAGRAGGANDDLHLTLTGADTRTGTEFWFHADQIGHTLELVRLVDEAGPVEVLIVGSSTSKRGFDPVRMTAELDRSTTNVAVAGLFPATMAPWVETALVLSAAPASVVIGVSSFQDFLGCSDDQVEAARRTGSLQEEAFAPLAGLAGLPGAARLVGGPARTYDSAALAEYQASPGDRGLVPSPDVADQTAIARQLDLYRPQLQRGVYCDRNAEAIGDTARNLLARGIDVLVVSLPISPAMAELHDAGRAGHQTAIDSYRRAATDAGARWLDLTDLLDEGHFIDLTHATATGRDLITDATISALTG